MICVIILYKVYCHIVWFVLSHCMIWCVLSYGKLVIWSYRMMWIIISYDVNYHVVWWCIIISHDVHDHVVWYYIFGGYSPLYLAEGICWPWTGSCCIFSIVELNPPPFPLNAVQLYFMDQDLDMYHEPTDTPSKVRTMNLNEDLGQVSVYWL